MALARHLPNLFSGLRIALVPVLLWLAWTGKPTAFLITFAFSLSTDLVDGYLARSMNTGSELGAKLDSWGDLATYAVFPLCAWWLFREAVLAQWMFVIAALIAFVAPTLVGLAKFRRITSYHTRLAKMVAIVMGFGLILYLGFDVPFFFQAAVLFLLIEAIEEIAITAVLPQWRANVPSIFSALQIARGAKTAAVIALVSLGLAGTAAAGAGLPDLVPEVSDIHVTWDSNVDAGDFAEGCAGGTTGRDLVRLSLTTRNDGPGALELGTPMCPDCETHPNEICDNPLFLCSPAGGHDHAHYQNFLRYEIVDSNGVVAAAGGKRSFCLVESGCLMGRGTHDCGEDGFQGLNASCWDTYYYWLGCQYVDVTDVPDGSYSLRVTVDPLGQVPEADETDNVIETPVDIFREDNQDELLEGASFYLKHDHVLRVRATPVDRIGLRGASNDLTASGATISVFDVGSGSGIAFGLPASGWKRIGKADDPRAFRYRGDGSDSDPCHSVVVSRGSVRARCNLKGEHGHFETPVQGKVVVQLAVGSEERRLCASFGGREKRNDERIVKRVKSEPGNCDDGE